MMKDSFLSHLRISFMIKINNNQKQEKEEEYNQKNGF